MQPEPHTERLALRREFPLRPAMVVSRNDVRPDARPDSRPDPRTEMRGRRELDDRPVHDARLLTEGGHEAEIRLDGVRYVLRITRQGKLILTK